MMLHSSKSWPALGSMLLAACAPTARDDDPSRFPFGTEDGGADTSGSNRDTDCAADDDAADSSAGEADNGALFDVGDGDNGGAPNGTCGCGEASEGVYLLGADASLWRFDPPSLVFTPLGSFECPTAGAINSMAVDRQGRAWINYVDIDLSDLFDPHVTGELFVVDLAAPELCTASDYAPPDYRFVQVGMAFASNGEQDSCDELFLYEATDSGAGALGRIDRETLLVSELGEVDYARAELTGTGDGRLYAFVDDGEARLVRYDTADANELENIPLPGFATTSGFSFAFWGGDVWFFTEASPGAGYSRVTRLDLDGSDGGGLTSVVDAAPGYFIGAGVSTCAPLEPVG